MPLLRSKDELIDDYNFELDYQCLNHIYFDCENNTDICRDKLTLTKNGYVYNGSLGPRCEIVNMDHPGIILYEVKCNFCCTYAEKLKSLKGGPEYVDGNFYCVFCDGLIDLEGGPKKVGGIFNCTGCYSLKSLKGSPRYVGGSFICSACGNLKSLKYIPEYVGKRVICNQCTNLKIIDYRPKNNPVFVFNN